MTADTRQLLLPNCHLDDGRDHWRNPLWLIPLIRETVIPARRLIHASRTRLANPECRHLRPHAAEAAICSARCFWQRSLSSLTSSIGMAMERILRLRLPRHPRRKASLQHRLQLRLTRQRRIKHVKGPHLRAFYNHMIAADYIWIGLAKVARADSRTASDMVGWAWQVRARSSDEPPNSIRTASSWIISPAL